MANEFVAQIWPAQFRREGTLGNDMSLCLGESGDVRCLTFPKLASQGYATTVVVPAGLTIGTGLTFQVMTTDDGTNADDLGKVAVFGITVKKLVSGSDTLNIDSGAATEATFNVTMDATTGEIVATDKAIANAALDSIGTGDTMALRLRRVGDSASDTLQGRVLLTHLYIRNT